MDIIQYMRGDQNTSSGHQIGHISTIFSSNLHKFSTKNWIWNQTQQVGEQNPYGSHQILRHISTIFSCNYINFEHIDTYLPIYLPSTYLPTYLYSIIYIPTYYLHTYEDNFLIYPDGIQGENLTENGGGSHSILENHPTLVIT
jgi:hypothetical protein